jgi:hypothetical protein
MSNVLRAFALQRLNIYGFTDLACRDRRYHYLQNWSWVKTRVFRFQTPRFGVLCFRCEILGLISLARHSVLPIEASKRQDLDAQTNGQTRWNNRRKT